MTENHGVGGSIPSPGTTAERGGGLLPPPLAFALSFLSRAHHWDNLEAARRFGRSVELAPASTTVSSVPVALPGEFERVIRPHPESNFALERHRLRPGLRQHPPTVAQVVADAVLHAGALVRIGRHHLGPRGQRLRSLRATPVAVDRALLCSDTVITRYFGHWLHDGLPLELLGQELGLPTITSGARDWVHGPGYRTLAQSDPRELPAAHCDELWLVDDRALNANRIARVQQLRERVRQASGPVEGAARKVFLMRGRSGAARDLANEAEVEAALVAAGFVTLHPERSSVDQIVRALGHADLVVAVEGSAQSHYLLAAPPTGRLLCIQPPQQFNAIFKTFFDAIGLRWGYVVADPAGEAAFTLPVPRLLQSLELLAAA